MCNERREEEVNVWCRSGCACVLLIQPEMCAHSQFTASSSQVKTRLSFFSFLFFFFCHWPVLNCAHFTIFTGTLGTATAPRCHCLSVLALGWGYAHACNFQVAI